MPEVEITVGGRTFPVSCQPGEEPFLISAAQMLDSEASALTGQIGRMPESRMLLMAGLMLADKTAGLEDRLREAEAALVQMPAAPRVVTERVEVEVQVPVPVVPEALTVRLAELAAEAEALAEEVEARRAAAV
jgi:cell division protein ZapA